MQGGLYLQRTITSTPYHPIQQATATRSQVISGLLVILIPVVVVCAIASYRKHKAVVLQRRIQRLNWLWQLDSSKSLS
jgi:hypothetical protein